MALTVFVALHVLLSETFTGAKNNPYPAEKASSWFHVQDWMRTWIVTCPIISIDVAQRLRSMLLFQARRRQLLLCIVARQCWDRCGRCGSRGRIC
ncbi:hypothetical protein IG631_13473 [Alternaria alternata]|nr:hypothetical protein IG631_13473 [Alternaria alternata]